MEKDKALSQDDLRKHQDEVQKTTDKHIEMADKIYSEKEKEIMAI
jgi:ribosome recycling factor